jgi:hypothetical protein
MFQTRAIITMLNMAYNKIKRVRCNRAKCVLRANLVTNNLESNHSIDNLHINRAITAHFMEKFWRISLHRYNVTGNIPFKIISRVENG